MKKSVLSLMILCLGIGFVASQDDYSAIMMEEQYQGL